MKLLLVFCISILSLFANGQDSSDRSKLIGSWKFSGFETNGQSIYDENCKSEFKIIVKITELSQDRLLVIGGENQCIYKIEKNNIIVEPQMKSKGISCLVTCNCLLLKENIDKAISCSRNADTLTINTNMASMKFILVR